MMRAFLLVISKSSLDSHQVTGEIGVQCTSEMVGVHPGTTWAFREKRLASISPSGQSHWVRLPLFPLNLDGSNLDQVVSAIVASLASQQIARRDNSTPFPTAPGPAGRRPSHRQGANRWVSDGIQVKPEMLKDVIFKTPVIEEFINSDSKFFISANKGFGKTLVLRYKRGRCSPTAHTPHAHDYKNPGNPSVYLIPEGQPFLDQLSDLPTLSKEHQQYLSNNRNSKRLWSFALRLSAVSHFPSLTSQHHVAPDAKHLPERVMRGSRALASNLRSCSRKSSPSHSAKSIRRSIVLKTISTIFFERSTAPSHIFIDKVDQGIRALPRQAWINVQGGLIEAAWDVWSTNTHVEIYATIREEAFANHESDLKGNL